jgi:DNA glycosylase AlkZ-like
MPSVASAPQEDRSIRAARMASLLLADRAGVDRDVTDLGVTEVVTWFGAMQGQDLASVMWSLGLRTGQTRHDVAATLESGEVLRTWPMRGTLHLVPGRDARWMLEHLGERALRGARARRQFLGLAEEDAERAVEVLGEALAGGRGMTRAECVAALEAAGVPSSGQRAYHLLWYTSQKGVTCVGPNRGKEQTFVLLDEFAPPGPRLDRPAALATIAERFVRSHGPVSEHDLARWADLTLADARAGMATAQGVVRRRLGDRDLFVAEVHPGARPTSATTEGRALPAHALPGFDELVLGYRDRSAQLHPDHEALVVPGGNGVFANTLLVDGRVVGTWRRRELAHTVEITATPFVGLGARDRRELERALAGFAAFTGRAGRISWSDGTPAGPPG